MTSSKKYALAGLMLGIYGDIYGRPYEKAFFRLLKNKEKLGEKFEPLVDILRSTFVFDEIGPKFKALGCGDYWDDIMIAVERSPFKFSDDTVLMLAVLRAIKEDIKNPPFAKYLHEYGNKYQKAGFGPGFRKWLEANEPGPAYGATTNGSAMRVGAIGYLEMPIDVKMRLARQSAEVTHNSKEGIEAAQMTVRLINMIQKGRTIKNAAMANIVAYYPDMPEGLIATPKHEFDFYANTTMRYVLGLLSNSLDADELMRNVITIGGDTDTNGMIAGVIWGAAYEVPAHMINVVEKYLPQEELLLLEEAI